MARKVGFAVVFTDITEKMPLPEEGSIYTAEMTAIKVALKEIHEKEDKRWIIYTDSQSSMQSMEYKNFKLLNITFWTV